MTKDEVSRIVDVPFPTIVRICSDAGSLIAMLSLLYYKGVEEGLAQAHAAYNTMFRDYNKVTLEN